MFETKIEPRVSETDAVGHINNTTLPVWFEAGRHSIFSLFNPNNSFQDWHMVILKMSIHFKKEIFFGATVTVKVWVENVGNTSLSLYEELWQNDTLCAISEVVYVNFDQIDKKSTPIPKEIKSILLNHIKENTD